MNQVLQFNSQHFEAKWPRYRSGGKKGKVWSTNHKQQTLSSFLPWRQHPHLLPKLGSKFWFPVSRLEDLAHNNSVGEMTYFKLQKGRRVNCIDSFQGEMLPDVQVLGFKGKTLIHNFWKEMLEKFNFGEFHHELNWFGSLSICKPHIKRCNSTLIQ